METIILIYLIGCILIGITVVTAKINGIIEEENFWAIYLPGSMITWPIYLYSMIRRALSCMKYSKKRDLILDKVGQIISDRLEINVNNDYIGNVKGLIIRTNKDNFGFNIDFISIGYNSDNELNLMYLNPKDWDLVLKIKSLIKSEIEGINVNIIE